MQLFSGVWWWWRGSVDGLPRRPVPFHDVVHLPDGHRQWKVLIKIIKLSSSNGSDTSEGGCEPVYIAVWGAMLWTSNPFILNDEHVICLLNSSTYLNVDNFWENFSAVHWIVENAKSFVYFVAVTFVFSAHCHAVWHVILDQYAGNMSCDRRQTKTLSGCLYLVCALNYAICISTYYMSFLYLLYLEVRYLNSIS